MDAVHVNHDGASVPLFRQFQPHSQRLFWIRGEQGSQRIQENPEQRAWLDNEGANKPVKAWLKDARRPCSHEPKNTSDEHRCARIPVFPCKTTFPFLHSTFWQLTVQLVRIFFPSFTGPSPCRPYPTIPCPRPRPHHFSRPCWTTPWSKTTMLHSPRSGNRKAFFNLCPLTSLLSKVASLHRPLGRSRVLPSGFGRNCPYWLGHYCIHYNDVVT